jgi:hypothetical protein
MTPANGVQRSRTWLVTQRLPIPPVPAEYKPDLKPGAHRDSKVRPIMGLQRLLNSERGGRYPLVFSHMDVPSSRDSSRARVQKCRAFSSG